MDSVISRVSKGVDTIGDRVVDEISGRETLLSMNSDEICNDSEVFEFMMRRHLTERVDNFGSLRGVELFLIEDI